MEKLNCKQNKHNLNVYSNGFEYKTLSKIYECQKLSLFDVYKVIQKMDGNSDEYLTNSIFELGKEMNIDPSQGLIGHELELITLVRKCKLLYDQQLPDFRNIEKKNAAWKAIARVLNSNENDVQQRWRSLREGYNKFNRDLELNCKGPLRYWEYYEEMKFIQPYIKHRSSRCEEFQIVFEEEPDCYDTSNVTNNDLASEENQNHIVKFINLVKSFPILYNTNCSQYRNKNAKQSAWKKISKAMEIPAESCISKWTALRERYAKERRLSQQNKISKWCYMDAMEFLNPHIRKRQTFEPVILKSEDNINGEIIQISTMGNPEWDFEKADQQTSQSAQNFEANQSESNDEDDLFGQAIAEELKKLPRGKRKMKLKADIYQLFYEYSE